MAGTAAARPSGPTPAVPEPGCWSLNDRTVRERAEAVLENRLAARQSGVSPTSDSPLTLRPIEFRSDNAAGAAPELVDAIVAANVGSALAYGGDEWTARVHERAAEVFEFPGVQVFPVSSGTAANAIGLSAVCPPWGAVLCHDTAHILRSECAATSMFGGGAALRGIGGDDYKVSPSAVRYAFAETRWGDPHHSQPSVLSLTSPTDFGSIYSVAEVTELASIAHDQGLRVHLDGARVANAIAALGCSPADLTWRAGVDVMSLGAIKNGAVSTDAIVSFNAAASEELVYRVKRAGHVASKMRFQSAQIETYLTGNLWLRLAGNANAMMQRLAAGLRELSVEFVAEPQVNMLFARVAPEVSARMAGSELYFYEMGPGVIRLVTSFQTTDDDIDEALTRVAAALAATS